VIVHFVDIGGIVDHPSEFKLSFHKVPWKSVEHGRNMVRLSIMIIYFLAHNM